MNVKYSHEDGRRQANLSDDADWLLFNGIADAILKKFKGQLVERIDGLDERYWDIEIGKMTVTLHLQHYIGIMLFPKDAEANCLIEEIGNYLEKIEPKKIHREVFLLKNAFRNLGRRLTTHSTGAAIASLSCYFVLSMLDGFAPPG
jgi:hypothetical protein